jgi:hypothetical protein
MPTLGPSALHILWVPRVKRQGCEAEDLRLVPMSRMVELYLHSPIYLYGLMRKYVIKYHCQDIIFLLVEDAGLICVRFALHYMTHP